MKWEGMLLPKYGYVLSSAIIAHHKGSLVKKSHRYRFLLLLSAGLNLKRAWSAARVKWYIFLVTEIMETYITNRPECQQ